MPMILERASLSESLEGDLRGVTWGPVKVAVITLAVAIAAFKHFGFAPASKSPEVIVAIGGTVASVGATMLGFLLATLAVLASINHTHLVKMMRQTGHYGDLLVTVSTACVVFLACSIAGFVMLFVGALSEWGLAVVAGLHVAALATLLDTGQKFFWVLTSLRSD